MQRVDPTDVSGVNERLRSWARPGEVLRPVAIDCVVIEDDAIPALVDQARARAAGGRVLLLTDRTPIKRGSEDLKPLVADRLRRAVPITELPWPEDPSRSFHPDLQTAREVAARLAGHAAIVSGRPGPGSPGAGRPNRQAP